MDQHSAGVTVMQVKAKPMGKNEIGVLLQLISNKKIITTKATNATNNRLKEEAWKEIAIEYSAQVGENRRPEQLRLKWENVKKAARKRSAAIRHNNLKTGGGKSYIPPDDILDRVASMLGATCTGFNVEFGGDAIENEAVVIPLTVPDLSLPESDTYNTEFYVEHTAQKEKAVLTVSDGCGDGDGSGDRKNTYTPKAVLFNTPKNTQTRRRKMTDELLRCQKEKEEAMASYFQAKARKVEKEGKKLDLENLKLELEIQVLKNSLL